jgi:hypothetical protein
VLALGLVCVAAARFAQPVGIGAALWGFVAALAMPLAAGAGAELVRRLVISIGAAPRAWIASPRPLLLAVWAMAIAGVAFATLLFTRRAGAAGAWLGTWLVWAGAGLALAVQVPGASYLFLVPALVAGAIGVATRRPVAALPALVAGLLWWGLALRLYGALGVPLLAATGAVVGLVIGTTAAAWSRPGAAVKWIVCGLGVALAVAGAIFLKILPHATPQVPERLNFLAYAESGGSPALYALPESGALPRELSASAGWSEVTGKLFPWSAREGGGFRRELPGASSETAAPTTPTMEVLESLADGASRRVRLRVASHRGAPILTLWIPPGFAVDGLMVNGVAPPPPTERSSFAPADRWRAVSIVGGPSEGSVVSFAAPSASFPVEFWLADRARELPASAAAEVARRPERAVPSHAGDGWIAATRVALSDADVAASHPIANPQENRR